VEPTPSASVCGGGWGGGGGVTAKHAGSMSIAARGEGGATHVLESHMFHSVPWYGTNACLFVYILITSLSGLTRVTGAC
jgi:hypothetical protein